MADLAKRLQRFPVSHRLWHLALIIIFMLMSVTGIAWTYIETPWGTGLANMFGGYRMTLEIHRVAGLFLLAGFALHILHMIASIDWRRFPSSLFSPDTLIFQPRDIAGFFRHLGWIVGLCKAPRFERWTWWEKFDYWAVWWGFMIVGITGLMLYDPVLTSDYMPGWFVNIALWVHRIEAVLAMAHVFSIHFFVEHFRVHNFPFNASMFDGTVDLEKVREEHPAWVERLESEHRLDGMIVRQPPVILRVVYFGFGYAIIALGILLLVFGLMNVTALTLF